MLRALLRFFSPAPQKPTPIDHGARQKDTLVLYAHVDSPTAEARPAKQSDPSQRLAKPADRVNHRERLMAMQMEHVRLCSVRRCERLREAGIVTTGDLVRADPQRIAATFGAPAKALRVIKRYRRAIQMAASVPGMMPRDAQLLISIHRRSVRGLARETPAALHRDLQRFAESSPGRRQLRGRRVPSPRRIKRWIAACEANVRNTPLHVAA